MIVILTPQEKGNTMVDAEAGVIMVSVSGLALLIYAVMRLAPGLERRVQRQQWLRRLSVRGRT